MRVPSVISVVTALPPPLQSLLRALLQPVVEPSLTASAALQRRELAGIGERVAARVGGVGGGRLVADRALNSGAWPRIATDNATGAAPGPVPAGGTDAAAAAVPGAGAPDAPTGAATSPFLGAASPLLSLMSASSALARDSWWRPRPVVPAMSPLRSPFFSNVLAAVGRPPLYDLLTAAFVVVSARASVAAAVVPATAAAAAAAAATAVAFPARYIAATTTATAAPDAATASACGTVRAFWCRLKRDATGALHGRRRKRHLQRQRRRRWQLWLGGGGSRDGGGGEGARCGGRWRRHDPHHSRRLPCRTHLISRDCAGVPRRCGRCQWR